ncbi:MAG TPA: MFS transporter [Armatimonadota bacterium]
MIVWISQSLSVIGSALTYFAITIWLTQTVFPHPEQKPALAGAIAAMSLVYALPAVFLAPLAGAWADRHDRRRTMMAMDALSGCLSLLLAALLFTGALHLWMLIPLIFLHALVGSFHFASFDTCYATLVPEDRLPRANGMMQSVWALSGILSPVIAATLIALPTLARQGGLSGILGQWLRYFHDGTSLAITFDAVTFFLASLVLLFLVIPSPQRADLYLEDGAKKSILADMKEGALYIWHRRPLLWLLGTFAVINLAGAPLGVLYPLIVKFNLQPDWGARGMSYAAALALLTSVSGFGGLTGGIFITFWHGLQRKRIYGVLGGMLIGGIGIIFFGLAPGLTFAAAAVFVANAMGPITNSYSQAIWQAQTPRELQGRVFSVRRLIAQCTMPLGSALAGIFAGLYNPGYVVVGLGLLIVIFTLAQFFNPHLRRVEDKQWLEGLAEKAAVG